MPDLVADAYATMATFREFIRNAGTSDATDPDSALELLALESAARAIDRACGRDFSTTDSVASARYYEAYRVENRDGYSRYVVDVDDFATETGLTVYFDTTGNGDFDGPAITAYRSAPLNAAAKGLPWTQLIFDFGTYPPLNAAGVKVTAKWGFGSAAPTTIQNANLIQAARFLKRRDSVFGVAGSPEMGNELRLLSKLDPDVAVMVSAFKRYWGAV